jgi:predicted ATPase/DNA-binding SARP family transcriptional activator
LYRFGVLGPLTVQRDGQTLPIASGRQRTLLAVLLAAGGPVSRDQLIDQLWGERAPATAGKALSVFISRLRAQVGDVVAYRAGAYQLSAGDYELDADRFASLVARARAEPAAARELLTEALTLFRGEPLADIDSDGGVATWRRALAQERLAANIARIDLDLANGQGSELVAELEQLREAQPYEERIWAQSMVALSRAGRQADALDAYQRVRRLFAFELGIEPGEPLARLQARILAGEEVAPVSASAGEESVLVPLVSPRPTGLPRPLGALVGRSGELAELTGLIADPDVRILTLVGSGGVGKTRLALEFAHLQEPNFSGGAMFVALEQVDDPALVAAEIAAAVGQLSGQAPPTVDRLGDVLADRELLLLLDNFEHVLPAAAAVASLVAGAPRIRVVVTSRSPLRVRGERLFDLDPLALPADDDANIGESSAVQLFLQLASAVDRRLIVDRELMRHAAAICRRVDGLPLGIELAAAQLRGLTPEQIEEALKSPLAPSGQAPRDLPARQRTLTETIAWSVNLLPAGAREALLAASVFRGGFALEALAAVSESTAVQEELDQLLDASLIRREFGERRFGMLELVRSFALDELVSQGRCEVMRERHRRHFAEMIEPLGILLDDGDPPGPLAVRLRPEHANLRAAFENAIESGDGASALALVRGMRSLWYDGWLRAEGCELIGRLLSRFAIDPEDELILLRAASFLEGMVTDSHAHHPFTERLALLAEQLGNQSALSTAVANLTVMALNSQDSEAVAQLRPRLALFADADIPPRYLAGLNNTLAAAAYLEGDIDAASAYAAEAVRLATSVDHAYGLGAARATQLMFVAIRDHEIRRSDLIEALATIARTAVAPLVVVALWLVARYAAEIDRDAAIGWMLDAERIYADIDLRLWPEEDLRAQTLAALGLETLPTIAAEPAHDCFEILAAASAWLSARDPGETSVRLRPAAGQAN